MIEKTHSLAFVYFGHTGNKGVVEVRYQQTNLNFSCIYYPGQFFQAEASLRMGRQLGHLGSE